MSIFNSLGSNYTRQLGVFRLRSRRSSPKQLRTMLKKRYNAKVVYVTYKGREALALALQQLNLPPDSHVVVNGYTCYAVHEAVVAAGLEPLYIDIEKDQLNFTAERLQQVLQQKQTVSAVMIQNTLGLPVDMAAIQEICKQHKLPLIEDLAHSIGLHYDTGQEAGTVGQVTALSFSQDKMIDAVSGGAAVFHMPPNGNIMLAKASGWHRLKTRLYPINTWIIRHTMSIQLGRIILKVLKTARLLPGPMSGKAAPAHSLPAWHSTIALRNYQQLPELIEHRQQIAAAYRKWLPSAIQFKHQDNAVYLRFPIKVEQPLKLITQLRSFGFYLSDRWYDAPISPKKSLSLTNYKKGDCPNAEYVSARMVNLPTHIHISVEQARSLCEHINQWLESQA